MTLSSETNKKLHTANGVQDTFAYDFKIFAEGDLKVYEDGVATILSYTVTGVGDAGGGDVVYSTTVPADTVIVSLVRESDYTQETDYTAYGPFPAETHESALDKVVMQVQQLKEIISRMMRFATDSSEDGIVMAEPEASKFLKWNSAADAVENADEPDWSALYYNGTTLKLQATNTGATLTGILIADGLDLGDNEDITFGAGPDAKISSDGTSLVIENGAGDETIAKFTQNGAVELYYNDGKSFETTASGITVSDTSGDDPAIYLKDDAGNTVGVISVTNSNTFDILIGAGAENVMQAVLNGAVRLYYDAGLKASTLDDGFTVHGCLTIDEITTPTADADHGKVYCKTDNKLYFQDGAGAEHEVQFV